MKEILTTTADLKQDYEIIGPVYFHISNHGFFNSQLTKLLKKYEERLENLSEDGGSWKTSYGKFALGMDNRFDKAFYMGVREMQERATELGGDAIIGLKQSIQLDQTLQLFHMQFYGTVVKLK